MQASDPVDEKLVWLRFQAGDEQAYAYLYNSYIRKLYHHLQD